MYYTRPCRRGRHPPRSALRRLCLCAPARHSPRGCAGPNPSLYVPLPPSGHRPRRGERALRPIRRHASAKREQVSARQTTAYGGIRLRHRQEPERVVVCLWGHRMRPEWARLESWPHRSWLMLATVYVAGVAGVAAVVGRQNAIRAVTRLTRHPGSGPDHRDRGRSAIRSRNGGCAARQLGPRWARARCWERATRVCPARDSPANATTQQLS